MEYIDADEVRNRLVVGETYDADTGNEGFLLTVEVEDSEADTRMSGEFWVDVSSSHPDCPGGGGN